MAHISLAALEPECGGAVREGWGSGLIKMCVYLVSKSTEENKFYSEISNYSVIHLGLVCDIILMVWIAMFIEIVCCLGPAGHLDNVKLCFSGT